MKKKQLLIVVGLFFSIGAFGSIYFVPKFLKRPDVVFQSAKREW